MPPSHGTSFRTLGLAGAVALALAALAACAIVPEQGSAEDETFQEARDPIEPVNRYIHDVNMGVDLLAVGPVATTYHGVVPDPYRAGVRNFLANLRMPVTILNSALQGDWDNTVHASVTFIINSTAGLAGIFDIPGSFDDSPRSEDFGQTLAVWGVGEGPYLVLPIVGPSNARDTTGLVVDILTDPLTYILSPGWSYARGGATLVQARSDAIPQFDELRRTSIDFYATLRSLYRQRREMQIENRDGDALDVDLYGSTFGEPFDEDAYASL